MTNPSFTIADIRRLAAAEHEAAIVLLGLARRFERLGRDYDAASAHADSDFHWVRWEALSARLHHLDLAMSAA